MGGLALKAYDYYNKNFGNKPGTTTDAPGQGTNPAIGGTGEGYTEGMGVGSAGTDASVGGTGQGYTEGIGATGLGTGAGYTEGLGASEYSGSSGDTAYSPGASGAISGFDMMGIGLDYAGSQEGGEGGSALKAMGDTSEIVSSFGSSGTLGS